MAKLKKGKVQSESAGRQPYEKRLKIKGTLFDVLRVAVTPSPKADEPTKDKPAAE